MSSLSSILNTAANALKTSQAAISVTGQNISNADNDDYSIQTVGYTTTNTVTSGGQIYGTGITVDSVTQTVNQLLENQLTAELSTQTALEEEAVYMALIENLLAEDTDSSLNTLLDNYWSAWESLSDTPASETAQEEVYETGQALADQLNTIATALDSYLSDLNREISSGVSEINALTEELASLNQAILQAESSGASANDLSDQRNALVDDLGELININITIKEDGSYLINTSGGLPLVEDSISHSLKVTTDDRVCWCGSSGTQYDITDDISGGSLAGWLVMRDEVIPEISSELDELASALIWALNYQHSQGTGQTYFDGPLEGTYATNDSGVLASLDYGDEIDYTKDFSMVIQDGSSSDSTYQTVVVDMGISQAEISDIEGSGEADSTYVLTVIDEGVLGEQSLVQSATGGGISSAASVSDALDALLSEQTLTISGGDGSDTVSISDSGGDARRSAADIAEELSEIDGITADASATEAQFTLDGLTEAQDGDIVSFTLYVDGQEQTVEFTVDASAGTLAEQFEAALETGAQEINAVNGNTDLLVDGCNIESASGATIGIQDFEVIDNAGVTLSSFQNFNEGDTLSLTVETDATPTETVTITVDLTDVDTTDTAFVAEAFFDAMADQLGDTFFSVSFDDSTGEITLRTTDGSGFTLSAASGDTGSDASMSVTVLGGSTALAGNDGQLDFDGSSQEGVTATTSTVDYLAFSLPDCEDSSISSATTLVGESGGSYDTAAALTGSVTILIDPGMEISSSESSGTGLFGAAGTAEAGESMITLGGTGGYSNFADGDSVSFTVDGYTVTYTVADPGTGLTDAEQADQLYTALTAALPSDEYEVIQNGTSVSIVRTAEADDPITLAGFTDTGTDATLAVSSGSGIDAPENNTLVSGDASKNAAAAVTWSDSALIYWEILDSSGAATGESGYIQIDEPGTVEITWNDTALTFEVSEGCLVAGNTLRINTDGDGAVDLLDLDITGTAAAIDDTYEFTVTSGGSVPDNGEDIVIEWSSSTASGTIVMKSSDSDDVPIIVEVDGMTLQFNSGTLVDGDVFYVTTDTSGEPLDTDDDGIATADTLSDWHWTLESFADEFNRSAGGVRASVSDDNTLILETNEEYCAMENISYSGADGISEENTTIRILDYTALETAVEGLQFVREDGVWSIENDPSGGTMQMIPEGGDDDGFTVDLDGDGIGDLEISFDTAVSGDGIIEMDLSEVDSKDFSFAFAGDEDGDSGLGAALGLNTFFTGTDAGTIGVNDILADGDYVASGMVDTDTGELASGDNTNALAMADTRYETISVKDWEYSRGEAATATVSETTLEDYEATLISNVGYQSLSIQNSLDYSETLVYQLTTHRDSISAVSLDEEMINLTAQQAAYSAAAKLLTTVDEMFEVLLAVI